MRYTAPLALAFAASTALASPFDSLDVRDNNGNNDNDHDQIDIFETANKRWYASNLFIESTYTKY